MNKLQRVEWIDLIRVAAAFLVVTIHVSWKYWQKLPGEIPDSFWLFSNFVDTFASCAVPLFFMISGYLLLRKPDSLKHGFFKRLLKICIPLIAWSVIYLFARWWEYGTDLMGNSVNFYNGIRCILTGNASVHLWFLYEIFSLYLIAPILHSYLKSASRENKTFFLLLWGCVCFLWPILVDLLKKSFDIQEVNFSFYLIHGNIGYFVAGYFLGYWTINTKTFWLCLTSLIFLALAITWIGFEFSDSTNIRGYLTYRLRIPLVLSFFVVIKYWGSTTLYRQSVLTSGISRLANVTFGIYLIHILIMHIIGDGILGFSLNIYTFDPWFSIPLTVAVVFFLSALAVWLLKKIPLAHWILP